jgi:hypothetical protein
VLKRRITYENPFTGQSITEEFHFHIPKSEFIRMEVEEHQEKYVSNDGEELTGMRAKLQRIVDSEDGKAMMPVFEDMIRRAYGRKDGDRFMRSDELWDDFKGSGAFDQLLFELCTDADAAANFVIGTFPANMESLADEISKQQAAVKKAAKTKPAAKKKPAAKESSAIAAVDKVERELLIANATTDNPVELTQEELVSMEASDLQTGLAGGKFKMPGTSVG